MDNPFTKRVPSIGNEHRVPDQHMGGHQYVWKRMLPSGSGVDGEERPEPAASTADVEREFYPQITQMYADGEKKV